MEHQVRRGIYRQKAQRLSIALAPVAAHRSLLFNKVRADLASKASYSELSPTSNDSGSEYDAESPALFMLTPQPLKMSAIISAKSAASIYSQDSYTNRSPFVANDNRRHAIAVSPSLQLTDLLNDGNANKGRPLPAVPASAPLRSAPLSALARNGFEGASKVVSPQRGLFEQLTPTLQTATEIAPPIPISALLMQEPVTPKKPLPEAKVAEDAPNSVVFPVPAVNIIDTETKVDVPVEVPARKPLPQITVQDAPKALEVDTVDVDPPRYTSVIAQDAAIETRNAKRASKHPKAFGKVLSRISMQGSKKEIAQRIRTDSISHPMPPMPSVPPVPTLPAMSSLPALDPPVMPAIPMIAIRKPSIEELKLTLPDVPKVEPIRTSFIAKVAARPVTFAAINTSIAEEDEQEEEGCLPIRKKLLSPTEARDKERRRRTTMPPTPTSVKRTLQSPMLAVPPMALRPPPPRRSLTQSAAARSTQHMRSKSSPTVMQSSSSFSTSSSSSSEIRPLVPQRRGRNRRWDLENMPPLPPLPPLPDLAVPVKVARPTLPLVPARKRSDSVAPRPF